MIKPLVLINLWLLASTAGAELLWFRMPAIETLEVTPRSAEIAVTPNVAKRPEWSPPRHAFWSCACGGLGFGISKPPERSVWDPLGQLADLFLAGEGFEVWALERAVDMRDCVPEFWAAYAYRDIAITAVANAEHGIQPQWVFARLVDSLTRGDEPYDYEAWFFDEPTLPEAMSSMRFKPDYVVTIGGTAGLRIEVDRVQRQLLVQSREYWSLATLPIPELEYLCAALDACIRGADATTEPTHFKFDESARGRSAEIAVQTNGGGR